MFRTQVGDAVVLVWRQGDGAPASAGTFAPDRRFLAFGTDVFVWGRRRPVSASVTVSLSGQAVTASAGTLTHSKAVAASGQAVTASAGTLGETRTVALSGQAATVSAGTVAYNADGNITVALSGSQITTSAGTLTLGIVVPMAGQAAAAGAGTVTYSTAGAVVVALTGQAVEASAGTMSYAEAILSAAPIGHGPGMSRRSPSKGGSRAPQLSTRTR